ncbi:MAG: hypothetical protein ACT4P8_20480 [Betaproteobacteria bacterium]
MEIEKMDLYLICYDLRNMRDYQPLWTELARLGAKRGLESNWWLEMSGVSAKSLREHFRRYIDSDDRLLVLKVSDWAGVRLRAAPSNAATA